MNDEQKVKAEKHKAHRYAFKAATNRFWSRDTEANFTAVEATLEQVRFDRMETETDPGPVATEEETPELNLEG
jgi:hypothetical protein